MLSSHNPIDSLQNQAYELIRQEIIYAHFAPGQKLSFKDLCNTFEMGRTPIRESLVRLSQEGLVHTVPQSGTYVTRIDLKAAHCARYIREHLERQATIECCSKVTKADLLEISRIIRLQQESFDTKNQRVFFDEDNHLHEKIFEIAGRTRVWQWLETINIDLTRYRWLRVLTDDLNWKTIMDQHYQIADAIAEKNPDEAGFLASLHLHMMDGDVASVTKAFPNYFK